jgi:signal transduction histidine kinase
MKFTVDTHLFRELGEHLVGRDSTALSELVKNSYDADATRVIIYGETLTDPERGYIEISDNGSGMSQEEFEKGFLRIASRLKEEGDRYSLLLHRRYTGAKGIGRLAAQKLAHHLTVDSVPAKEKAGPHISVHAEIDWDLVERSGTLDDIDERALRVELASVAEDAHSGTTIRLSRLRQKWTEASRSRFVSEVRGYQPALILTQPLVRELGDFSPLSLQPTIRDFSAGDPGFEVLTKGDFEQGDEYWERVLGAVDWVLEICAKESDATLTYLITPTLRKQAEDPTVEQHRFSTRHPDPEVGPFFEARICVREGPSLLGREDDRSGRYSGIRLYVEGFRVLPYGERGNDWLGIDADYNERKDRIAALEESGFEDLLENLPLPQTESEGLVIAPQKNYIGGVFLTQKGASSLRLVVNREGFEPDVQFNVLVGAIRMGLGLLTRVRAYHSSPSRLARRALRKGQLARGGGAPSTPTLSESAKTTIEETRSDTQRAESLVRGGDLTAAAEVLLSAAHRVEGFVEHSAETLRDQSGMLRVLASIGLQMGGFVHEIRSAVGYSKSLVTDIEKLRQNPGLGAEHRRQVAKLSRMAHDLNTMLEWLSRSLSGMATVDKRRRKSRQVLRDCFEEAADFVRAAAERRGMEVKNDIPADLKTGPLFASELFAILLNLLSNAVKYAGTGGRVSATGTKDQTERAVLHIENTGALVKLEDAETLFKPFVSTSTESDPVLGQGMGLGLPVTRDLLEELGGEIRFVAPSEGYATAVEVVFPR